MGNVRIAEYGYVSHRKFVRCHTFREFAGVFDLQAIRIDGDRNSAGEITIIPMGKCIHQPLPDGRRGIQVFVLAFQDILFKV